MDMTRSAALPSDRFVALVGLLNRECTLIERLVFKLTEVDLLATAGESRFIGLMVDEVDAVGDELGSVEVARGVLVADLAYLLGLDADDTPLSELIPYAPSDVAASLTELKDRLTALAVDLENVAVRGSDNIGSRLSDVRAALEAPEQGLRARAGYNKFGKASGADVMPRQVDRSM